MIGGTLLLILLNDETAPDPPSLLSVGVGNRGDADIAVGVLSIVGASQFTITADPVSNTSLAPGAQRTVKVHLDTTTPGTYAATLRVPSSDRDGTLDVMLVGVITAALAPGIAVDPTGTVDFGSVDITTGTSVRVFTVTSSGTGSLVCGTVALTGTGYAKSADGISGVTIPAGESRSVTVTLDPSSIGTKTGTLTFPGTGVTSVVVNLTGLGTTGAPAPVPTLVTRFYLSRQASPVGAIASGGQWASETTDADRLLGTSRAGPVVSLGQTVNHDGANGTSHRLGRWVSPPLEAQVLDAPVRCYCTAQRSTYLGSSVTSALRFGILRASVVTWQAVMSMGSAVSPWQDTSAPKPQRFPAGTPGSWHLTTTLLAGDRLVVELGYRAFSTSTNGARIRYGGSSTGTDLDSTESPAVVDLTKVPWVDFTGGLLVSP